MQLLVGCVVIIVLRRRLDRVSQSYTPLLYTSSYMQKGEILARSFSIIRIIQNPRVKLQHMYRCIGDKITLFVGRYLPIKDEKHVWAVRPGRMLWDFSQ